MSSKQQESSEDTLRRTARKQGAPAKGVWPPLA